MAIDHDDRHTLVHAAGATTETGGILIPGERNAGKSTLVTGLIEAGFGYLTDEAVAIDHETGDLLPFPKAIGLDRGSWPVLSHLEPAPGSPAERFQAARWHVPPGTVRPDAISGRRPMRWLISTRYEKGADTAVDDLTAAEGLAIVLEHTFCVATTPDAFGQLVDHIAASRCHRLVSGDLAGAVAAVRDLARS